MNIIHKINDGSMKKLGILFDCEMLLKN